MSEPWIVYVCSHCGYAEGNHRTWCNAGCGKDYNCMEPVEVEPVSSGDGLREALDGLIEVADRFLRDADYTVTASLEEELVAALGEARSALGGAEGKDEEERDGG